MNAINAICCAAAAATSLAVANAANVTISIKQGDMSLDSSWEGGVAPRSSDTANFAVDGAFGPFTMSSDMTVGCLNSGGWGRFTDSPQQFNLKGHTLTLSDSTLYSFQPCNGGPRNHIEFSNGKIAFSNAGSFTIGYNKGSFSGSWLKLSALQLTGAHNITIGDGDGGNHNCELKLESGSQVSVSESIALSPYGIPDDPTLEPNRLFVDGGSALGVGTTLTIGGGSLLQVTDGASMSVNQIYSGKTAGSCKMLISNATVSCGWSYESGCSASCSEDSTEVVGSAAKLSAGRLRPGASSARPVILAHDGATLEGTAVTYIGHDGPATVVISNANLKAHEFLVGNTGNACGSKLKVLGGGSSLAITYNDYTLPFHDLFGAAGSSSIEIAQGANLDMWQGRDSMDITLGSASSGNEFAVKGTGTVYNAPWEYVTLGSTTTAGNVIEVADHATYNIRRMTIQGANVFKVSDSIVNIGHGNGYHTSLVVGGADQAGSELILSGIAPKINFIDLLGGVMVHPGAKVIFELPAEPYAVVPLETFWLNISYDKSGESVGQIDIDVSNIPKTHERLKYKLATVIETEWLHQDVIDRVNNLDQVKAVKGRLAWKDKDLVFTVPGTLGLVITVR